MKLVSNKLLLAAAISALLAGCDSGGINIAPENNDNSVTNPAPSNPDPVENPCATIESTGVQGTYSGTNCSYGTDFVSSANPLVEDLYLPALPNGGAHIFSGSLFVGENFDSDAEKSEAATAELEIQAGTTVAFKNNSAFMVINRGSKLFARGTEVAPITFTSESDVRGTVGAEDVSQWGGMVINGFGVTNKCAYTGNLDAGTLVLDGECHILAEGAAGDDQSNYGGADNEDSSGEMTYVRVKHTGAQVANGDELNGIAFNAVGSGTVVKNLQAYSTYDDGIEFFGGAVNIENYVALYVRDDSIDIDEGYRGTITNALVIQSESDGNQCIESDGIGSYKAGEARNADIIAKGINSRPVIDGLTCIVSPQATGTHDPGAGWRFREGIYPTVTNSLVVASFKADENGVEGSNSCLRVESAETVSALESGDAIITSSIFACEDKTKGDKADLLTWAEANGNQFADIVVNPTANNSTQLQLLGGAPAIYSLDGMIVDDAATTVSPVERAYLGALSVNGTDWTQGWTYGLHQGSRAKPLWFE